ncbi:MAG: ROK family protein [Verrucomicrobia bacterium]|nr:MAG: ROK family protein [Verrucomicrobiota bacterium]
MEILGIDIGGSGVKGAPVDLDRGELLAERVRLETPQPAKPKAVADLVAQVVKGFDWKSPIGVGFPGIMRRNIAYTAANLHSSWIDRDLGKLFGDVSSCPVGVINDADAAGLAEMTYGAGRGQSGAVLLLTLGTGIGSALFIDGHLYPNTEFGHLQFKKTIAEKCASSAARKERGLSWTEWGDDLNELLIHLKRIISPDLVIIGGGASSKFERFGSRIDCDLRVVPAQLMNNAGIIGAALAGREI